MMSRKAYKRKPVTFLKKLKQMKTSSYGDLVVYIQDVVVFV